MTNELSILKTTSRKTDTQLCQNQDHLGAPTQRNLTKTAYDRQLIVRRSTSLMNTYSAPVWMKSRPTGTVNVVLTFRV